MPGDLARRHDGGPPVEGDLKQEPGVAWRGGTCWWDVSRHILLKDGLGYLAHYRVLHQALARSLRESKVQFVLEDTWPFGERARGQNGRLHPLHMAVITEATLFDNHPRRKKKALLLDITIVNPCVSSNLENAARHAGNTSRTLSSGRKTGIGARSPLPTPSFLSLCRRVANLAQTCNPSSKSSPSNGWSTGRRYGPTSPSIWRRGRKWYIFGNNFIWFCSRDFHFARVIISADRGYRLRAPDSSVPKAHCLYTCIVARGNRVRGTGRKRTGAGAGAGAGAGTRT